MIPIFQQPYSRIAYDERMRCLNISMMCPVSFEDLLIGALPKTIAETVRSRWSELLPGEPIALDDGSKIRLVSEPTYIWLEWLLPLEVSRHPLNASSSSQTQDTDLPRLSER